jgi:hypothetical protein
MPKSSGDKKADYENRGQFAVKILNDTPSYDYKEPIIYQFTHIPTKEQINKLPVGAYVFVKSPDALKLLLPNFTEEVKAYKIMSKDRMEKLNWTDDEIKQIFTGYFTPIEKRKKLSPNSKQADFYIMHELPENPLRYLSDIEGNSRFAYILSGDTLSLLDRLTERFIKTKLDQAALQNIKIIIGIPDLDLSEKIQGRMINVDEMQLVAKIVNLNEMLADETLPLNDRLDEGIKNQIIGSILEMPGHSQGGYKIYKAVLDTRVYTPNFGNTLDGKFITPKEEAEISLPESVKEFYKNNLTNKVWLSKQLKVLSNKTIYNPDWLIDQSIKAINLTEHTHLSSVDVSKGTANAAFLGRIKTYKESVVEPRTNRIYQAHQDIDVDEIHRNSHKVANSELAVGKIPLLASAWIISDADYQDITAAKKIDAGAANTFICFSQEDADKVVEAIKNNHQANIELLTFQAKTFDFENNTRLENNFALTLANEYRDLFESYADIFGELVKRQNNYVEELHDLANPQGMLNREGPREYRLLAKTIWQDFNEEAAFPHFDKIEIILNKLNAALVELDGAINQNKLLRIEEVNEIIRNVADELKSYIRQYPYLNAENSIPHMLLNTMHDLNNYTNTFAVEQPQALANETAAEKLADNMLNKCNAMTQAALKNYFKILEEELNHSINYSDLASLEKSEIKLKLFNKLSAIDPVSLYINCRDEKNPEVVSSEKIKSYFDNEVFHNQSMDQIISALARSSPDTISLAKLGLFHEQAASQQSTNREKSQHASEHAQDPSKSTNRPK